MLVIDLIFLSQVEPLSKNFASRWFSQQLGSYDILGYPILGVALSKLLEKLSALILEK